MSVVYSNNDERLLAIIDDVLASEPFGSERHRQYVEMRAIVVARLSVEGVK